MGWSWYQTRCSSFWREMVTLQVNANNCARKKSVFFFKPKMSVALASWWLDEKKRCVFWVFPTSLFVWLRLKVFEGKVLGQSGSCRCPCYCEQSMPGLGEISQLVAWHRCLQSQCFKMFRNQVQDATIAIHILFHPHSHEMFIFWKLADAGTFCDGSMWESVCFWDTENMRTWKCTESDNRRLVKLCTCLCCTVVHQKNCMDIWPKLLDKIWSLKGFIIWFPVQIQ